MRHAVALHHAGRVGQDEVAPGPMAPKNGRSRSLVLRGEAGVGKTALLDYAAGVADGMRVLHVVGVESEAEIPVVHPVRGLSTRRAGR